ncbi:MAG TPA: MiaB/RimO family radical SAM methylthiotransferase [Gemmatimonadaceae bacterium]|nr:MiaB/RimO family radical SAM methylthiotransferase [Gemmatimonadaceae bacterium]
MKVYLRTYGCRANQYDTEAVRSILAEAGISETSDPSEADAAVFNSCTVTSAAEADLRSDVRAVARRNPRIRTVVMGCAAALPSRDETKSPLRTLPTVDSVIGGCDALAVAAALGVNAADLRSAKAAQSGARALLRIQDGCDEHCTFCATTIARGANRSRSVASIVEEASALAETHPEIVLTGIHIGTYGADIGSSLSLLVERLVHDVPRVRFRLTSVEATEVDERLADLLNDDAERVAPHLHAPLQSGSDAVLKRMGRHWYDARSYASSIDRIVSRGSRFALSADVITGFPGETEGDHRQTVSLVESLPFTSLHVFPYSARPGTAATRFGSTVPGSIARERARELREVADRKEIAYRKARAGGECDVVVTERGKGLTEDYLSVAVADSTIPRRSRFRGRLHNDGNELTAVPTLQEQ